MRLRIGSLVVLAFLLPGVALAQARRDGEVQTTPAPIGDNSLLAPEAVTPNVAPLDAPVPPPTLDCKPNPGFVLVEAGGDTCVFRTERPFREPCACGGFREWYDFNVVRADSRSVPGWNATVSDTCVPCD